MRQEQSLNRKKLKVNCLMLTALIIFSFLHFNLSAQTMCLKESSGTKNNFDISNLKKMTFSSGDLKLQKRDNTIETFSLNEISFLSFYSSTTEVPQLQDLTETHQMTAFPNPFSDMLTIDLGDTDNKSGILQILSLEGKTVHVQSTGGEGVVKLNVSHFSQGIYICYYNNGTTIKTVKLFKQ